MKNPLSDFVLITLRRLLASTPRYHKAVQTMLFICGLITGLPYFLSECGLPLPAEFSVLASKIISVASFVGIAIAQLSVEDPSSLKNKTP